jgi:hypothetical protein
MKSFWQQVLEYLYLKKRDPNVERNQFTKYMHGMNRISIFLFLIALMVMLFKMLILPFLKK